MKIRRCISHRYYGVWNLMLLYLYMNINILTKLLCFLQACIGDVEKNIPVSICLYVKVNEKKLALGTLNSKKLFQQSFDLVFDKTFEISHNWKNGSIFFLGYTADNEKSDRYPFLPMGFEINLQAFQVLP